MRKQKSRHTALDAEEILVDSVSALAGTEYAGQRLERPLSLFSVLLIFTVMGLGMLYLLVRAADLQIANGAEFLLRAEANRFVDRLVLAPRGIIRDRFGVPLVENIPFFEVVFERDHFLGSGADIDETLGKVKRVLGIDDATLMDRGLPKDINPRTLPERVVIANDIPPEDFIQDAPHLQAIPGIAVYENFRRMYRDPTAVAHLIGYVGRASTKDILNDPLLSHAESIGKQGIEASYDRMLRGQNGRHVIEVNATGNVTPFALRDDPVAGADLELTVDFELQQHIYATLMHHTAGERAASAVALDPTSGAVRGLVSIPSFDANRFSGGLTQREFDAVLNDPLKPLFNRAIAGTFPSGSVIKPFIATAALNEQVIDPDRVVVTHGYLDIPNPYDVTRTSRFLDWRNHGPVNLSRALAVSSNVYFYIVGGGYQSERGLGIQRIKEYLGRFGFGSVLGIDIPGEQAGAVPDPDIKAAREPENPVWRVGDTYNVSIGQGGLLVTPLQITAAAASVANGGTLWRPYIVAAAVAPDGTILERRVPEPIRVAIADTNAFSEVRKGMREAVTAGTAGRLSDLPVRVAAKTGTAQTGKSRRPHAWVSAYLPADNPELVVTVMVEHAGEGATVAMPIMREILEWYAYHRMQ